MYSALNPIDFDILDVAKILAFLCSDESGIMTGSIIDFDQTVAGWHSYSAYDTKVLDDSILGEWT